MIEIKIEKYDSPIHCIKCGIQTISSVSKFIKLENNLATDSMLMHNVSCIDKCECEYGKESHDSHVLKYIKNKDSISPCPHLVYLGKGGGFDENRPEYCKFYDELMQMGSENYLQTLREELDNEHVNLNIQSPTSPLARYFVVYNLGDLSKEKKYFNGDKDCPYWNVWGPTLKKYGIDRG